MPSYLKHLLTVHHSRAFGIKAAASLVSEVKLGKDEVWHVSYPGWHNVPSSNYCFHTGWEDRNDIQEVKPTPIIPNSLLLLDPAHARV